jgi:energy-coupling factor transporter ATP-binding protein EcfA2
MEKKQQNRLWRYARLGFVALAFVLCPYLVSQIPELEKLLDKVPDWLIIADAIGLAAIVVVGPDLPQESETDPEELLQKLAKENREIIKDRLKDSNIPIASMDSPPDLGHPSAVDPQRELQNLKTEAVTELKPSKPILEVFESAKRRLLILGEPGSGKTTELLKLANALAEEAKKDPEQPIPIIFELSAWRGEPMLYWIADRMAWQYGVNVQLCRKWLKNDRIVPLLDGLDDLGDCPDEYDIKSAIQAINILQDHYQKQQSALVICGRIQDYETLKDNKQNRIRVKKIDRALRLCPLTDEQIQDYLSQQQGIHLWQQLPDHPGWMQLARNPMLLNLMPIAYPDRFPQNTPQDPPTCQNRLFEDFLQRQLQSQPLADYQPKQSQHYLAWLAASMQREEINQREFLIEGLQPTCLETAPQWQAYRRIAGSILGSIFGLMMVLFDGSFEDLIFCLVIALSFSNDEIKLTKALDLSWNRVKRGLSSGFREGLRVGRIGGLIVGLFVGLFGLLIGGLFGLLVGLFVGLLVLFIGLIAGLIAELIRGLKAELKVRTYPNQGIWETGMKTLIPMALCSPICILWVAWLLEVNLVEALIRGGGMGILLGFILGGGVPMMQHFALRLVLSHQGRMPWNYAKFLTAASDAGILKQSGGYYRFYHDKLQEYLARTWH